jgi:hypothetical protein
METLTFTRDQVRFTTSDDTFPIHDNGGRPFLVKVMSPSHVKVYQEVPNDDYDDNSPVQYKSILEYPALSKVMIGQSVRNAMTMRMSTTGARFTGNSILLENGQDATGLFQYIMISRDIFTFTTKSRIVTFVSPVGNNDVPYPHAIDKSNKYYILWAHVILDHVQGTGEACDVSDYWCDVHRTRDAMRIGPVETWYWTTVVDPADDEKEYNRLCTINNNDDDEGGEKTVEPMFIKNAQGDWERVDLQRYKEIQTESRHRLGCCPLVTNVVINRVY